MLEYISYARHQRTARELHLREQEERDQRAPLPVREQEATRLGPEVGREVIMKARAAPLALPLEDGACWVVGPDLQFRQTVRSKDAPLSRS